MKKFFNLLMVALMAVCFAIPAMGKAEAAKVVVLPLVNNSGSETAGQIYISGAIQLFDYPEYELLENDVTNDAIAAANIGKDGASKDAMVKIAKASGADLVVGGSGYLRRQPGIPERRTHPETGHHRQNLRLQRN